MVMRADWMSHRRSVRILMKDLWEDKHLMERGNEVGQFDHYKDWLIARGGNRMRRAYLKGRDRYQALQPAQIRASALHRAYRRKRR